MSLSSFVFAVSMHKCLGKISCVSYIFLIAKLDGMYSSPCGLGARMQPTTAVMRVVRGDYLRDVNCPHTTGLLYAGSSCMQ